MDEDDARGVRIALTAIIGVIAAGLGSVLALAFIGSGCRATACDTDAYLMIGLIIPWSVTLGVVAGRAVYMRSFGSRVALAFATGWFAVHFLAPASFFDGYMAMLDAFGGQLDAWAMLVWVVLAALMVAAGWFGGDLAERVR